jgi:RNA polymerase sigma-70 factor (ECF subfamily)
MADEIESVIRRLWEAGDFELAVTRAIEAYGPEIGRFIAGRARDEADARDVFSLFCEDLWRGLPGFAWRCTLRGWAYTIARHAELRYAGSPRCRGNRNVTFSDAHNLARAGARTATPAYERTDVKDRFRQIRLRLGEEDQLILVLRVDRALGWTDIAHVLTGTAPPAAELRREEARIRKRFQLIKERLRRWAIEEGLLATHSTI